jgi:hypothetical protein
MASQTSPCLGILNLERRLDPDAPPWPIRPGSPLNPATYDFPIILETVEGAWAENVILGDPSLEPACIAAARRLVERGAIAITANCGFFFRHQAAIAAAVDVPVATSSLLMVPTLLRQIPKGAKLAIVTADSTHFGEDLLAVESPADRKRIVIGGIEGSELLRNELLRPPKVTPISSIEKDVIACLDRLRTAHPEIAAVLFECTGFPMVSPALRRITKLPVHDLATLCRMMLAAIARTAGP